MTNTNKQNLNQNLKSGKTQIPLIVENLFAKTTPKNIMRDLAENFFTRERIATHQQGLMDARRLQTDVLHKQYAQHLGLRHSYVNEVLTEYPNKPEPMPAQTYVDASGQIQPQPNYEVLMTRWENKHKMFRERQDLESQIKGLHMVRPELGRLHREINDKIAHHRTEINKLM